MSISSDGFLTGKPAMIGPNYTTNTIGPNYESLARHQSPRSRRRSTRRRQTTGAGRPRWLTGQGRSSTVKAMELFYSPGCSPNPLPPRLLPLSPGESAGAPPPSFLSAWSAAASLGTTIFILGGSINDVPSVAVQLFDFRLRPLHRRPRHGGLQPGRLRRPSQR